MLAALALLSLAGEAAAQAGVILGRIVDHLLTYRDCLVFGLRVRATSAHIGVA